MMEELDALFPQPTVVTLKSGPVEVWPLRARQFGPFARAVAPLLGEFNRLSAQARPVEGGGWTVGLAPADWAALVWDHADTVIRAVAVALEKKPAEIGALFLDELVSLAATVVEVNADFFARRLLPTALEAMGKALAGPTPSTGSSEPDTETSAATP